MKIFLSHSHAQAATADALALALRQDGHEVFLDTDELKAAEGYHRRIREQIEASDLFVFLISPQALEAGRYALTELGIARERWKDPSGHVLPVMAAEVPFDDIPAYLKAVTLLQPRGDLVAETVARVAAMQTRPRGWRRVAVAVALVPLVVVGSWLLREPIAPAPCLLDASLAGGPRVTTLEIRGGGAVRSFVVVGGEASVDLAALTASDSGWIIAASQPDGQIAARFELDACPTTQTELHDDDSGLGIRLSPRS